MYGELRTDRNGQLDKERSMLEPQNHKIWLRTLNEEELDGRWGNKERVQFFFLKENTGKSQHKQENNIKVNHHGVGCENVEQI